jgi:hypothetical protein
LFSQSNPFILLASGPFAAPVKATKRVFVSDEEDEVVEVKKGKGRATKKARVVKEVVGDVEEFVEERLRQLRLELALVDDSLELMRERKATILAMIESIGQ